MRTNSVAKTITQKSILLVGAALTGLLLLGAGTGIETTRTPQADAVTTGPADHGWD